MIGIIGNLGGVSADLFSVYSLNCELAYKVDPPLAFKIAPLHWRTGPADERLSTYKRTDCNINRWINSKRQSPI